MIILLELIFQGFFEWVYSLILECWNFFFSSLLDIMTLDFAYIKTHVPVVEDIMEVFLAVGWALLLGNLVFQAIRSMVSGLGFEGEDPKLLFARTFVFSFLLLASPQICEIGLNLTSRIMDLLEVPDAINVHLVDSGVFGTLTAAWLLVIIFDIIIMFKVLKLLLEVAERYVILAVLTVTAPLAFSMGGSKSTAEIFSGWCRMFGSMCLLMVTNVMFFKMLLSVVSTVPSGLDVFPWMVLIITIVKVARKADEIITRIGLNPAITGDRGKGFGSVLAYTVLRSATSKVVKTIGAAATGGASTAAGAVAGGVKAAAGPAGAAGAAGTAGAAGAAFRSGGQRGAAQRPGSSQEQQTGTAPQGAAKESATGAPQQASQRSGASRKSAVPQGARRGTSNIAGTGTDAAAGTSAATGAKIHGETPGGSSRAGGGAGRDPLRHSGKTSRTGGTPSRRGVNVYVGDDFDDGQVGMGGGSSVSGTAATAAPAGGAGRSGLSGVTRPAPPTDDDARAGSGKQGPSSRGPRQQGSRSAQQSETRSTRKDKTASSSESRMRHSGPAGTRTAVTARSDSPSRRQSSSTVRQEQHFASSPVETPIKKGGGSTARSGGKPAAAPAGTRGSADRNTPRSKRQGPAPARQEAAKQSTSATAPLKSGGAAAPPAPAGTGGRTVSDKAMRSRDRSPSPARREQFGGPSSGEVVQKDGAPKIHPGIAGTGGTVPAQTVSPPKQRSSSPVQQEAGKAQIPTGTKATGGGPVVRPGPAGTGGSISTQTGTKSKQRGSSPVRQEQGRVSASADPPIKGGGPIARPDGRPAASPTGTVKGAPKRSTRAKHERSEQGGTYEKPRP